MRSGKRRGGQVGGGRGSGGIGRCGLCPQELSLKNSGTAGSAVLV
jgi:hypothetical protein